MNDVLRLQKLLPVDVLHRFFNKLDGRMLSVRMPSRVSGDDDDVLCSLQQFGDDSVAQKACTAYHDVTLA